MTAEALWYQCFQDGHPPKCRRLCRQPMQVQWEMAIEFAIAMRDGYAGYRPYHHSITRETWWFLTDAETGEVVWWMIPARVEKRIFALCKAAEQCETRLTGRCDNRDVVRCLKTWKRNGQWRKVAAGIFPRHTPSPPVKPAKRKRRKAKIQQEQP